MKKPVALGTLSGRQARIVVGFDHGQFDEIRRLAEKDGRAVAVIIRELVEWGLEAAR